MDNADLAAKVAALEERMNTKQAEYKTDIARLAERMAESDARSARREVWLFGIFAGMIALGVAFLGFLIRLPAS